MYSFDFDMLLTYALAAVRMSAILFALPIFGDQPVPVRVRVFLSVGLAFGLSNFIEIPRVDVLSLSILEISLMVVKEIILGAAFGYASKMTIIGMTMAASFVGYQMGFGTANLMMPGVLSSMDAFTAFHRILVLLIFLALNLHFIFISGIYDSFKIIPLGEVHFQAQTAFLLTEMTAQIFVVALKLAAPVLIALLFTMAALGLMARTVPQMNVFTLSFPVSFFLGLIIYIGTIPFFPGWFTAQFYNTHEQLQGVLNTLF